MTALTLAAGAAAFGDLADGVPTIVLRAGAAVVAAIAIIQITTRVAEASFQHRDWMKRWTNLELKIKQKQSPTKKDIEQWQAEISLIEAECVSECKALRILCEDESARYLSIPDRQHNVWLVQRLFANFGTFQPNIKPIIDAKKLIVTPPSPEHPPIYP
jgi:Zn-dependent M32 family carboxypeptidase